MSTRQWKMFVEFMFHVIYLLNRKSSTPTDESNWTFEYKLEKELKHISSEELPR